MRYSFHSKMNMVFAFVLVLSMSFVLIVSIRQPVKASTQSDWPTSGYDSQHTHYNPNETTLNSTNVSNLILAWQASTTGIIERLSSPIIANGIVYIGDDTDTLYAYNATTGNLLWNYNTGTDSFWPSVTIVNSVAYVVNESGALDALNAQNGSLLWSTTMPGGALSSPTVDNGVIYVGVNDANGALAAFNANTGTLLWNQRNLSAFVNGPPAIINNIVYATTANSANLYALDAQTGNILWSAFLSNWASGVAVANGIVYTNVFTQSVGTNLYAFNASGCGSATCSPLWTVPDGGGSNSNIDASPAVANGVVYVGSSSNGTAILYSFNATTGASLWTGTGAIRDSFSSTAAVANGVVYDATTGGTMYAFNASGCGGSTCMPLWTYNMGTGIETQSSPAVVNGMVYIGAFNNTSPNNGSLFAFSLPNLQSEQVVVNSANNQSGSIQVSPADTVEIYATGTVNVYNSTKKYTPVGNPKCVAPQGYVLPGAPCFELIGQIGSEVIQLKDGLTFHPTNSGVIFLNVNYIWGNILQGGWTVTIVVNPSTPRVIKSANWSGYIANNPKPDVVSYNDIRASWKVNAISCGLLENSQAAVWVGLGGIDGGLEQIGTLAQCIYGVASYSAVYEIKPSDNKPNTIQSISPGITVTAEVQNVSAGNYKLSIGSTSWQYTDYFQGSSDPTAVDSAECIVENPSPATQAQQLSNFGKEIIHNCIANSMPVNAQQVVNKAILINNAFVPLAQTSTLDGTGTEFSVKWLRSG